MLKTFPQQEPRKKEVWPPNVKEFYLYCNEAFKPIASVREAYYECQDNLGINMQYWSHPIVFYSMLYAGSDLIKQDFKLQNLAHFKKTYLVMVQLQLRGILPALPAREQCEALICSYAKRRMHDVD